MKLPVVHIAKEAQIAPRVEKMRPAICDATGFLVEPREDGSSAVRLTGARVIGGRSRTVGVIVVHAPVLLRRVVAIVSEDIALTKAPAISNKRLGDRMEPILD